MKSGRIKTISLATKLDYGVKKKMTRQQDIHLLIKIISVSTHGIAALRIHAKRKKNQDNIS